MRTSVWLCVAATLVALCAAVVSVEEKDTEARQDTTTTTLEKLSTRVKLDELNCNGIFFEGFDLVFGGSCDAVQKPKSFGKKTLQFATRSLRNVVQGITATSVTQNVVNKRGVKYTVLRAETDLGYLGILVKFRRANKNSRIEIKPVDFTEKFLESNEGNRLVRSSNVGVRGLWVYVLAEWDSRVELLTPNPTGLSWKIRKTALTDPLSPPKPVVVLGQEMRLRTATSWISSNTVDRKDILTFGLGDAEGVISQWYRRSRHPNDLEYLKNIITKIKSPYDPVEGVFSTVKTKDGLLQMITAVDKNGFIAVVMNIVEWKAKNLILKVQGPFGLANYRSGFISEIPLGLNPAFESNVLGGRKGLYVFALSQIGVLAGRRSATRNIMGVCRFRQDVISQKHKGVALPGGSYSTSAFQYEISVGLTLVTEDILGGGDRGAIGFRLSKSENIFPYSTCAITQRSKLRTIEREINKAADTRFKAVRGVHFTFAFSGKDWTTICQAVYVIDKDGRIGGILNVPPIFFPRDRLWLVLLGNGDFSRNIYIQFDPSSTNVRRPGRNVFIASADAYSDGFEVTPSIIRDEDFFF
eukprot:CAMPEP_0198729196 /NCGR_PEP_ID=MMETSP1475-20131203/15554_1 /TAXON_ID= ORGANISM="Unidentified sp., Strain CCMP1999" /NCGR_SAMPLE_ID=MMETSP1475 /ASSEMBLY_ACC=CAM_ASM_001111 /LENGTH=582 /DNA_ID=CAMNT_0044491779 /DNA_START=1 /DNA_END=1749 /DNA_ORIENTATION=+